MTQEETFVFNSYQRRVQIGFSGTLIKHNETMTIPKIITLVENSQQVGNSRPIGYQMKSLKQWHESPVHERVTNFSRQFVNECMEKHLGNYHDSAN